jgi:hypothetical protein
MFENETKLSPEDKILETLIRLADETGNVEIYEKQLLSQVGEEANHWDLRLYMTNLKERGAFMGKPFFRSGDARGVYFSVILRSEKRFPTPDTSNLRYD